MYLPTEHTQPQHLGRREFRLETFSEATTRRDHQFVRIVTLHLVMYSHGLAFHGCSQLRTWAVVNLSSPLAPMNSRTGERAFSNRSQSMTNESLADFRMQKRKLENLELRLADETRAFRPENGN